MRILAGGRVFIGQRQLDCAQETLPERFKVLLCLLEGAERRRQIQTKLNVLHPRADGSRPKPQEGSDDAGSRVPETSRRLCR